MDYLVVDILTESAEEPIYRIIIGLLSISSVDTHTHTQFDRRKDSGSESHGDTNEM